MKKISEKDKKFWAEVFNIPLFILKKRIKDVVSECEECGELYVQKRAKHNLCGECFKRKNEVL